MTSRCFFHVDMDAFYASVEQRDNPEIQGKPVIIGALPGHRGVVSACSYEAREFGVRSAMPVSEAYRRCPKGIYILPRMERYAAVSREIMACFKNYSPKVQQISIDEAFIDMTGTRRLFGPPVSAAKALKKEIKDRFGLTISVGIAETKYLAKMASDFKKPDGLFRVLKGKEIEFLDQLELKDIWGLGKKTIQRLEEFNIYTVQALRETDMGVLKRMVGDGAGEFLHNAVRGTYMGLFDDEPKSRSISNEVTFERDTNDKEVIYQTFLELSHHVMFRAMDSGVSGKTVQIKVRHSDFTTTTAQKSLRKPVCSGEEINEVARQLLKSRWNGSSKLRLVGVGLSSVQELGTGGQGELFEDDYDRKKKVEQAVYELNLRYGSKGKKITKASLSEFKHGRKQRDRAEYNPPKEDLTKEEKRETENE